MSAASIPTAEEAVDRYRRLAETDAATYLPDLANSLNNLALDLDRVGSSEQALSCLEEAIGHYRRLAGTDPGNQLPGRPCLGSWIAYGLGSMNANLPTFVVLNANHTNQSANVQAISARLWSAGFMSPEYSGVALRTSAQLEVIVEQMKALQERAREIIEQASRDVDLIHAECRFHRVAGRIYHLYERGDGHRYFSMLGPAEFGGAAPSGFVASYRYEHDEAWTRVDEIDARDRRRAEIQGFVSNRLLKE